MAFTETWRCAALSATLLSKKKALMRIPFQLRLLEMLLNNECLLLYPAVTTEMIELLYKLQNLVTEYSEEWPTTKPPTSLTFLHTFT